jgi:hypothetical protein
MGSSRSVGRASFIKIVNFSIESYSSEFKPVCDLDDPGFDWNDPAKVTPRQENQQGLLRSPISNRKRRGLGVRARMKEDLKEVGVDVGQPRVRRVHRENSPPDGFLKLLTCFKTLKAELIWRRT